METPEKIPFASTGENFYACERCGQDLSNLPIAARFCPRCGLDQVEAQMPLIRSWRSDAPPRPPVPDPGRFHSVVVVGYGRAMNSLGERYESGQGVMRNRDEAVRCYCKAARLGNDEAQSKLAEQGSAAREATSPDAPSNPPSPPEATESQNP